jgi:hypothetical protein
MTTVPAPNPQVIAWNPQQGISTVGKGALQQQTAPAGAAVNVYINCQLGSFFALTLLGAASTTTVEFVNPQPGQDITLEVVQSASGSDLITWINCVWASGTAPTLTTTAGHKDCLSFIYDDVNAVFIGSVKAADYH